MWNGSAWVPQTDTRIGAGVQTLNTLSGNVALTSGANISIVPSGQNLSISSTTGVASNTAPLNPYGGQVWYNTFNATVSGIPVGRFGVWNGSVWVDVGLVQPNGSLLTLVMAPTSPLTGSAWQNISGATLSGIPSGSVGVWNGSAWINTIYTPSTISINSARIGFFVTFPVFTVTVAAGTLIIPTAKVYDTFGAFDLATGTYTVPASQEGVWLWDVGCSVFNNGTINFNIFASVNSTVPAVSDVLHSANAYFGAVGQRPLSASQFCKTHFENCPLR